MKITVIGTGYVGLITATCFAELGNHVVGVDVDVEKLKKLRNGESPIYEPGLTELLKKNIKEGRLTFTEDSKEAVKESSIIYIAVGTPQADDGSADLSYLVSAIKHFAPAIDHKVIIVNKSTVPVGTGNYVKQLLIEENISEDLFAVVSNPEFLKEGSAVNDFMYPERVVVGSDKKEAVEVIAKLYGPLTDKIIKTNILSAELIKYASNGFLATKISFINEISNICDKVGANVREVAYGMGLDTRIGGKFLNAGIGYGGSCFPKDTLALIDIADKLNYEFKILKKVVEVNHEQRKVYYAKVKKELGDLKGKKIAVWGLAFKDNTDDVRESPALDIIPWLLNDGAEVFAYDPIAQENAAVLLPESVNYVKDAYDTLNDADALLIITDWKEFRQVNLSEIKKRLKTPLIIDGRNMYSRDDMDENGLTYIGMGI
ncbi:UDP-glucose/GDP-mannose dehydrogenase family protein [Candidatus Calescamantes bacterium]|nr:UDP-glucose/GDP-mannose dehydrogenase family protein [Candidatus Calescamantes bacterium]MCK5599145.1 UDP-glucose/GDP-mannose dehydrogenase family protein [bacterium]